MSSGNPEILLLKRVAVPLIIPFMQISVWVLALLWQFFPVLSSFLSFVAHGGILELWQVMHAVWSGAVWVEALASTGPAYSILFAYFSNKLTGHYHLASFKLSAILYILQSILMLPLFPLMWQLNSSLSDLNSNYLMQLIRGNSNPALPPDYYQQTMALINPMLAYAAVVAVCGLAFSISLAKGFSDMRKRIRRREFRICTWSTIVGVFASALAAALLVGSSSTELSVVFSATMWLAIVGVLNILSTSVGLFIFAFGLDAYARQEENKNKFSAQWPSNVVTKARQVKT